jgi:secondary thiamine-phosphate synthase enzyme
MNVADGFGGPHILPSKRNAMRIAQTRLSITTAPREIREVTAELARWTERQGIATGMLSVYIAHTSASLLIQENASPDVRRDLDAFLQRIVPEDVTLYRHNDEGPDDMPAHIKSALTQTQLTIPVTDGRLQLGTWQGIFLLEHRASSHDRSLVLTLIGEEARPSA